MDPKTQRLEILHRVERGELTLSEANRMLQDLEHSNGRGVDPARPVQGMDAFARMSSAGAAEPEPAFNQPQTAQAVLEPPVPAQVSIAEPGDPMPAGEIYETFKPVESEAEARKFTGWRSAWLLIFGVGLLLTLVSANWMVLGLTAAGLGWGFWLSFFPFGLGVLAMWAGWEMRRARWLHVRIRQRPGAHPASIAFSIPLPIGLTRWAVQRFGRYSPIPNQDISDFLQQMNQAVTEDDAVHIFVDDPNGEQVEIWMEGPR